MPATKSPPKAQKDEKPGKVRRFLNFLGIKKKQPAVTSPELLRYELDNILDDIAAFADELPSDHPRKADVKNSIGSLENQAKKDIKKAIEMAHGVLDWAAEELRNAKSAPSSGQTQPQVQPPPKMQPQVQPPPKAQPVTPQKGPPQSPPALYTPPLEVPPEKKATLTQDQLTALKSEKPLGSGSFATTYKMTGPDGQNFAVKVPQSKDPPENAIEREMAAAELKSKEEEFKVEAEFYKKVGDHPNIAKCYGYQTVGEGEDKQSGLVMELIEGKNAKDLMGDLRGKYLSGEMSPEEYFGVMQYTLMQMLKAADHMGKQGVAHRDVKPDNVMIDTTTGDVKVVDFGISQNIGQERTSAFPLGFTAPEVAQAKPGIKDDAFSIGASAYAWSEQEVFDYKSKDPLSKGRTQYDSTKGPAIQKENEEDAYLELMGNVRRQMTKWEQTQAANTDPNEVAALKNLMKQAEEYGGPDKKFGDGIKTLRELQDRLPAPQDARDAKTRFKDLLNRVQPVLDMHENSLKTATGLTEPERLKALMEAMRPLMAQARKHADLREYDAAIAILQEMQVRLQDAEAKSGKSKADTAFTKFINKLMDPDPNKRMSPEEAMNDEFMKLSFLDDESARRVLQMQVPQPDKATDPGANAPRDKRYAALDRAAIEAERQVRELKSALPTEAAERMTLVVQMQTLARECKASKETLDQALASYHDVEKKGGNANQLAEAKQKFQDADLHSHNQLEEAWKKFEALKQQLEQRLSAARKDQEERAKLQAELTQVSRLLTALESRSSGKGEDLNNLVKQAQVQSKPGGDLEQAWHALATVKLLITTTFDAQTRQTLLNDGIAQARAATKTLLELAEDQLNDVVDFRKDVEKLTEDARVQEQSAFAAKKEGDTDRSEKMATQARNNRNAAAARKRDVTFNETLGNQRKTAAEEANKLLSEAEQLAQSLETIDQGLVLVDRANQLTRVSLAEAAKGTNQVAEEKTYETSSVNQRGEVDAPERPEPTTADTNTTSNAQQEATELQEDPYQNTNA